MKRLILPMVLLVVNVLLPLSIVKADTGPKPMMYFTFVYPVQPIPILDGQQLECDDPTCADGKPLITGGPQRFVCNISDCYSLAYGYKPYHKLVIRFADRTRESNVFQKHSFSAQFTVTVTASGLTVEEVFARPDLLPALVFTVVVETLIGAVYLLVFRQRRRVLAWIPVANVISLPLVWFLILRLQWSAGASTAFAEGFAFVFEAGFLYYASRKALPLKHAIFLSLLMNTASFVLPFLLSMAGFIWVGL